MANMTALGFFIGGLLGIWLPVNAAIVVTYRGDSPNVFAFDRIGDSPFDINGDDVDDFTFSTNRLFASFRSEGQNRFVGILPPPVEVDGNIWYPDPQVVPLPEGTYIGADASFPFEGQWHHHTDSFGGEGTSGFLLGYESSGLMQLSDAYIGVEFWIDENIHYGWIHYVGFSVAEFTLHTPDGPVSVWGFDIPGGVVDSWAYNATPGESITAGQVPEPATVALLAGIVVLGAACFIRRRRMRNP